MFTSSSFSFSCLEDAIMTSREVLCTMNELFLNGKSVTPSRVEALHTLYIYYFLAAWGEGYLKTKTVYVTVICTTLHRFLVVISTNVSIQQNFSSCIQLMVGELFSSLYYGL